MSLREAYDARGLSISVPTGTKVGKRTSNRVKQVVNDGALRDLVSTIKNSDLVYTRLVSIY